MLSSAIAQQLEQTLRGLQYGSIQLVVHEGQIVRIERIERTRLTVPAEAPEHPCGQPTTSAEVRHGNDTEG